ncbi:TolC family outer membrane protein [Aquella oligotrophica]|uniref:TolC family outer membrane protein n=1 Tax=Aquella oligotrophica TaxID=2067065 RepID=A0A2I7N3H5_9NEIS|nr:TolC family outer membrane protein [Aquella oligotrophica]AUR51006.1 hypothetical protein CUN60_01365 [Aquella oligotrophica]
MKKKLLLSILYFSPIFTTYAVDLFEAYQKALVFNADYLKAVATNDAGQENPNISRAAILPQVNANVTLSENYVSGAGMYAFYHQPIYGAQLNQVVFDFSKFSTYTRSKFSAQLSTLQLENARQQLMVDVAQAYFDVLYAEDVLLATQMTAKALEQQLIQAKEAFQVGTVPVVDVNDAQAAYDASMAQELQDENNLIYKKNIFRNLTGLNPDLIQPLQTDIELKLPVPQDSNLWAQMAESGNLNVKIANKQLVMAKQDISIARSGHLPTINLLAQYMYQDTGSIDNTNATSNQLQSIINVAGSPISSYTVGYVGLQLSVPIYSGGEVNAKTRQAAAIFESSQEQLTSVQRQTDQNIRNAYWNVANGVSFVQAQKAALKSAKTKVDSDKLGYQVGIRNSVNLVNAQKDYFQTFKEYQQSRYKYLLSEVQLQYLSGMIDERFLQQINANIKQ